MSDDKKDDKKGATDLTGLGKLAESKLAQDIYTDAAKSPLKAAGALATDVLEGLRLFTLPFKMMGNLRERLEQRFERIRQSVPPERQQEADPAIAGPAILGLRFIEDDNPLARMYEELLKRAIDKDYSPSLHPAFPVIIQQLSPREATLFYLISKRIRNPVLPEPGRSPFEQGWANFSLGDVRHIAKSETDQFAGPEALRPYQEITQQFEHTSIDGDLLHLKQLGILSFEEALIFQPGSLSMSKLITWSDLGFRFAHACLPDECRVTSAT